MNKGIYKGPLITSHRKRTIVLIFVAGILLIAIMGIFLFLQEGKNSDEVKEYREQITEENTRITESLISEVESITESATGKQAAEQSGLAPEEQKAQVQNTLTEMYYEILLKQKAQTFAMADGLVEQCKAEYVSLKQSGNWNAAVKASFISKYLAKSDVIEEQMDESFNALVNKMEEQLKAAGIDSSLIIEQYRVEYKLIKEENRSNLMDKALAEIKN
ncbi:MAG: hypothetical protein PHR60_03060 [Eubacteriales bacterium]|nr:hypothetical protein [Eubacteriales bacterium]